MLAFGRTLMTGPDVTPRRTVHGSGAVGRRRDVRDHRAAARDGRDHPARRAERRARALAVSDHVYVMQRGQIVASGAPEEVRDRTEVMSALFG